MERGCFYTGNIYLHYSMNLSEARTKKEAQGKLYYPNGPVENICGIRRKRISALFLTVFVMQPQPLRTENAVNAEDFIFRYQIERIPFHPGEAV